jgi:hypothetical protein
MAFIIWQPTPCTGFQLCLYARPGIDFDLQFADQPETHEGSAPRRLWFRLPVRSHRVRCHCHFRVGHRRFLFRVVFVLVGWFELGRCCRICALCVELCLDHETRQGRSVG